MTVTARWRGYDETAPGFCTATAETTLAIAPANPIRDSGPPRRDLQMNSAARRLRYGRNADLRPVEMRLRGVPRARLPGPSARVQTVTFAFRRGDRGFKHSSPPGRRLRSAGWRFQPVLGDPDEFGMEMTHYPGAPLRHRPRARPGRPPAGALAAGRPLLLPDVHVQAAAMRFAVP